MANPNIIVPHILAHEGGLSRAKTDSASLHPAPYTTTAKDWSNGGQLLTKNDWHTNKGVTWQTFNHGSTMLGYEVNQSNWEKMPQAIWQKIYKLLYWDALHGDQILNQAIANVLAEWSWLSGNNAVKNLQQVLNRAPFQKGLTVDGSMGPKTLAATNQVNQAQLYQLLVAEYADYVKQIGNNSPANLPGWTSRLNDLIKFSTPYVAPIAGALVFFCSHYWVL